MDLSQSADSTETHNSLQGQDTSGPTNTLPSDGSEQNIYSSQQNALHELGLQAIQHSKPLQGLQSVFDQQGSMIQAGQESTTLHSSVEQSPTIIHGAVEQSIQHGAVDTQHLTTQNNPVQLPTHDQPSTSDQLSTEPAVEDTLGQDSQPSSTQDGLDGLTEEYIFCRVCGDRATGCHYGVRVCEGCKGFFKRTSKKDKIQACRHGNGLCIITSSNRNQCIHCRYKKCLATGMSREAASVKRLLPKPIEEEEEEQQAEKDPYEMTGKEESFKCHCKYFKKKPCYTRYTQPELMALRNQYKALNKKELDIAILAKLQTGMHMSLMTIAKKKKHVERKHCRSDHYIHGERICRETFCFIHRIAAKKLQTLMAHYRGSGVCRRIMKRQVMKERNERLRQAAKAQKLKEKAKTAILKLKLKQKKQEKSMIRANNEKQHRDDTQNEQAVSVATTPLTIGKKKQKLMKQSEPRYEADPALMVARHIEAMHQYVDIQIGQPQADTNQQSQHLMTSPTSSGDNPGRQHHNVTQHPVQHNHSMWHVPARRPDPQHDGSYLMPL